MKGDEYPSPLTFFQPSLGFLTFTSRGFAGSRPSLAVGGGGGLLHIWFRHDFMAINYALIMSIERQLVVEHF